LALFPAFIVPTIVIIVSIFASIKSIIATLSSFCLSIIAIAVAACTLHPN